MSYNCIIINNELINLNLVKQVKPMWQSNRIKFYFVDRTTADYDFDSKKEFENCYYSVLSLAGAVRSFNTNKDDV